MCSNFSCQTAVAFLYILGMNNGIYTAWLVVMSQKYVSNIFPDKDCRINPTLKW